MKRAVLLLGLCVALALPAFAFVLKDVDNAVSVTTVSAEIDFTDPIALIDFSATNVFVKSAADSASTCYFYLGGGTITANGPNTWAIAPDTAFSIEYDYELGGSGWDAISHICASGSATFQIVGTR